VHQNVRKLTLWALLLLPLVAVGVAVTLMVSWGSSQGAQAATAGVDISLYGQAGACDTNPGTGAAAKCSASTGSNVTVKVQLDKFNPPLPGGWNGLQAHVLDSANLTLTTTGVGTVKSCPGGIVAVAGGDGDFTAACQSGISQPLFMTTGNVVELVYTCTTQGAGTVTLVNGAPPDSHITDAAGSVFTEATPTDVLAINCVPPDRQIQINKTDSVTGASIGPSCWQVFVFVTPLSPPPVNVPVDVVGDNGKVCAGASGALTDSNAALGEIDITISGAARVAAGSDVWHVLETQAPTKYQITNLTKQVCDLASANCVLDITNLRVAGNINVAFNDTVTGLPLAGQCVDVDAVTICDNNVAPGVAGGDSNAAAGAIAVSPAVSLGAHTCVYNPVNQPADRQVKAPTSVDCSVSTAAPKASVKFNFNPTIPFNLKAPTLANLFLTAQGTKLPPSTCAASTNVQTYSHDLSNAPSSADPKDPTLVQQVGGFEMDVLFDEDLICVNLAAGAYFTGTAGAVCFIDDKDQGLQPDGLARIGCVIKGKPATVSSSLQLAVITVRPQPELYSLITADQDNGVNAQILNSGCNLADMQGHPIKKIGCDDSEVTIRWLEGDVNGDCAVDVRDQQILAFRWGVKIGSALYNGRFDLEPWGQINNDNDIDIKDVQFVYGRHGSVCTKSGLGPNIWPPQPPRNEKLTNP